MSENDTAMRVYEFSYLIVPTMAEEALPAMVESMKSRLGDASFIMEEAPRIIALAYPMTRVIANKNNKFSNAYFGWVKFSSLPEAAEAVTKAFERDENIIRFLLIKTVEESTLAPKKLGERNGSRRQGASAETDKPEEAGKTEEVAKTEPEAPKAEEEVAAAPETN